MSRKLLHRSGPLSVRVEDKGGIWPLSHLGEHIFPAGASLVMEWNHCLDSKGPLLNSGPQVLLCEKPGFLLYEPREHPAEQ